jgi:protein SCO1
MLRSSCLIALVLLAGASALQAQYPAPTITKGVKIEQKLNSQLPLDLAFHDESGKTVSLRTYFHDKPVLLELVYFKCPSLCPMSLHETVHSLSKIPLEAGKDYNVVVASFDPADTPAVAREKKAEYAKEFDKAGFDSGWHFLTGSQDSISRLADAAGFRYRWDERSRQFVHAGGIMVATPEGRLSRYFYGIQYAPADLRMALVEASHHKIGSPVDYVLLYCFHYDPYQAKYTLVIVNVLKIAGCLTVLILAGLIYILMRSGSNKRTKEEQHVG